MNLRDLDFENVIDWPIQARIVLIAVIMLLIFMIGYWLDISNERLRLRSTHVTLSDLKTTYEAKQQEAANLDAYRHQLALINQQFNLLLQKLPSRAQVPGLLEDISKIGNSSGLQFKLFKPLPDVVKDFYVEIPIQMEVIGSYHQIASFISQLANLDRIISLHDFTLERVETTTEGTPPNPDTLPDSNNQLLLTLDARTYHYKEDTNK